MSHNPEEVRLTSILDEKCGGKIQIVSAELGKKYLWQTIVSPYKNLNKTVQGISLILEGHFNLDIEASAM